MTDQNNQEPTMEEILASIRRIISEDDPPAGAEAGETPVAAAPAAEPVAAAPPPAPAPLEPEEEEDVLELTQLAPEPEAAPPQMESVGDLDVFASPAPAPAPAPPPAPEPVAAAPAWAPEETLLSQPAASSAASAFAALTGAIAMPRDGRNIEDVVRELLRPLMKQWLDENLPRIVETAVQTEVERIARRHG